MGFVRVEFESSEDPFFFFFCSTSEEKIINCARVLHDFRLSKMLRLLMETDCKSVTVKSSANDKKHQQQLS